MISFHRASLSVDQLITREKDRERLIQRTCDILIKDRSYPVAWIALIDEKNKVVSTAGSGVSAGLFSTLVDRLEQGDLPNCMRTLLQQKEPSITTENVRHDHKGCPLVNTHKVEAGFACRLEYEGKLYGIMSVDVPSHLSFNDEEQSLFLELCEDISFSLANIEREEERKLSFENLKRTFEGTIQTMAATVESRRPPTLQIINAV